MFENAISFSHDVSSWDTGRVLSSNGMWNGCVAYKGKRLIVGVGGSPKKKERKHG